MVDNCPLFAWDYRPHETHDKLRQAGQATIDPLADAFEPEEAGVALVGVEHLRMDVECAKGAHATDAEDDLLLDAHLVLVQTAAQHLPGLVAVAVLAAVVLALHDDAGRRVRDTDRRVGFVDVLSARTRGTEGVDA